MLLVILLLLLFVCDCMLLFVLDCAITSARPGLRADRGRGLRFRSPLVRSRVSPLCCEASIPRFVMLLLFVLISPASNTVPCRPGALAWLFCCFTCCYVCFHISVVLCPCLCTRGRMGLGPGSSERSTGTLRLR